MQATGVLPMRLATSVNESKVSLFVFVVRMTSTSLERGHKWEATKREASMGAETVKLRKHKNQTLVLTHFI